MIENEHIDMLIYYVCSEGNIKKDKARYKKQTRQ